MKKIDPIEKICIKGLFTIPFTAVLFVIWGDAVVGIPLSLGVQISLMAITLYLPLFAFDSAELLNLAKEQQP